MPTAVARVFLQLQAVRRDLDANAEVDAHLADQVAEVFKGVGLILSSVADDDVTAATFHQLVRPGDTLTFSAKIDQFSQQGASASGTVMTDGKLVAEIELMFSHIDQNMAGMEFPEHNFVFTEQFTELLKTFRVAGAVQI